MVDEEEITFEIVLGGELDSATVNMTLKNWLMNAAPFCC